MLSKRPDVLTDKESSDRIGIVRNRKTKQKKRRIEMNIWKSDYSGEIYEMPTDWLPQFPGWTLIGTKEEVEKELA